MSDGDELFPLDPADAAARHAARRRAGVPTVGVHVGADWANASAADTGGTMDAAVANWLGRAAPRLAADAAAGARLAAVFPELGRAPLPVGAWGWTERLGKVVFDGAEAVARSDDDRWRVLVAAVAEAVGPAACPALTLWARHADQLAAALRFLTRLAERCPTLEIAVRVPEATVWEEYERTAPESREKALAREGLIFNRRPTPSPPPSSSTDRFASAQAFLERLPVGSRVRGEFAAAVAAAAAKTEEETTAGDDRHRHRRDHGDERGDNDAVNDRARSAAERFLFDLLEALPDTRGLFQLNAPLPFRFGLKTAEADLLAADLRLVVEVDGYRHFTDAEGYRRDRRKDFLLQSQGYLVLRCLADDVVTRLEDILADIREAAALRRLRRDGGSGPRPGNG